MRIERIEQGLPSEYGPKRFKLAYRAERRLR